MLASIVVTLILVSLTPATAQVTKHFCFSIANLLPGSGTGFTNCINPNAASCVSGFASANAVIRHLNTRLGEPTTFLTTPDQFSAFVQMHPKLFNVNMDFFKHFGVTAMTFEPSGIVSAAFEKMRDPVLRITNSIIYLPPEDPYEAFIERFHVDPATGIGFVVITNVLYQRSPADWRLAVLRALEALARDPNVLHIGVVDWNSIAFGLGNYTGVLQAVQQMSPHRIDFFMTVQGPATRSTSVINGTRVLVTQVGMQVRSGLDNDNVMCADLVVNAATNAIMSTAMTVWSLLTLPSVIKDARYYADVAWVQTYADAARSFDPTVGYTMVMPVLLNGTLRRCHSGWCPQGYMFVDALAWITSADIGLLNAGGPRGTGWPAGPIKYSDLFGANPFTNTVCLTPMRGITIWELLNYSIAFTLSETFNSYGNQLLLPSGLRVHFGNHLQGGQKIVGIDFFNKSTQTWGPLDRLRLYSVVTSSYECAIHPYYTATHIRARYAGETLPKDLSTLFLQKVAAEFLTATTTASAFYTQTENRFINVPTAVDADALIWTQRVSQCKVNEYWDVALGTCFACPAGQVQPAPGSLKCEPQSSSSSIAAVVAPIVVALAILAVIPPVILLRSQQAAQRNVANAPKEGQVTLMFTDIQDSTKLWSNVPRSMSVALDQHHELIRTLIAKHRGYEVKTAGDSFMIAFATTADAVALAVELQRSFQATQWPLAIEKVYRADGDEDAIDDDPTVVGGMMAGGIINGLRVRVGIHCDSTVNVIFDEVTKGYDYYGPAVNVAARVEGVACGGQIAVSAAVISALTVGGGADYITRGLGMHSLKGVSETTELFEVIATEMQHTRGFIASMTGGGGQADNGSTGTDGASVVTGCSDTENHAKANYAFLVTAMRAMTNQNIKQFRKILFTAWRIEDQDPEGMIQAKSGDVVEPSLERLSRRVIPRKHRGKQPLERRGSTME